jgi:hypothetical protein
MTYEELMNLLRQNELSGGVPVGDVSINDIISGIQSQYQPVMQQAMPQMQSGASRFISGTPNFGAIEVLPEYGTVYQAAGPQFAPSQFDENIYRNVDAQKLSNLIQGMGDGGSDGARSALSTLAEATFDFMNTPEGQSYKDAFGKANSNLIGGLISFGVPGAALANMVTGYKPGSPITAFMDANKAFENATAAMQAAITNYGANALAMGPPTAAQAQALMDALAAGAASSYGTTGPGSAYGIGVGSREGINAMDALSDAYSGGYGGGYGTEGGVSGIGVGSSEGINSMDSSSDSYSGGYSDSGGYSGSDSSSDSSSSSSSDGSSSGSDGSSSGSDSGSSSGSDGGYAMGGMVTRDRLIGMNPNGADDGYGALDAGEYVIRKSAVDKYGEEILSLLNDRKISKKKLQSLL